MKTIIFFIIITIYLSLALDLIAQEEYVLSAGDIIQVFIYQYQPSKAKVKLSQGMAKQGLGREPLQRGFRREKIKDMDKLYFKKKGISAKASEEKSRGTIIRPDGKVTVPFIGEVMASGRTLSELDRIITQELKPYMPNPEVTVMLTGIAGRKNKVYVLGEVQRPGLYPVAGEMCLLKALTMAGSPTKDASLSKIYLDRNTSHGREIIPLRAKDLISKLDLSENVRVYPGDIIRIPRSKIVALNDYIGRYIKPLEFGVLFFNLSDTGMLDAYGLVIGLTYGIKWIFFDESPALATSSINIPLDSWIYQSLDDLAVEDLITTKPLTRNEASLLIKDVEEREDLDGQNRKVLEKLEKEFEESNKNIHGYIRTGLVNVDSHDKQEYFDYQRDQNQFGDGLNPRTEFSLGGDIFPKLSCNLTGSLWYNGAKGTGDIKESYLKLNFKNLEIEVGRDHLWWGPGYHGSLLLSGDPPPFDLVKLTTRTERFKFTTFLTRLEKERTIPKPYLNGMRFEWLPFDSFTLGGSRMIMFMGKGRPSLKIGDIASVLGGENAGGRLETNQLAGLDFRWRHKNLELYGAWAGEDQANGLPSAEGYQIGTRLKEFFHKDLDMRIEYAINRKKPHQKATWYEHHLYQIGYTYKGRIIGHHMGGDSQDIFFRLGYKLSPKVTSAFEFDYERHGMIKSIEEKEIKYALEAGYDITPSSSIFIRHENWWTKNNGFVANENVRDSFTRLEWEYRF